VLELPTSRTMLTTARPSYCYFGVVIQVSTFTYWFLNCTTNWQQLFTRRGAAEELHSPTTTRWTRRTKTSRCFQFTELFSLSDATKTSGSAFGHKEETFAGRVGTVPAESVWVAELLTWNRRTDRHQTDALRLPLHNVMQPAQQKDGHQVNFHLLNADVPVTKYFSTYEVFPPENKNKIHA